MESESAICWCGQPDSNRHGVASTSASSFAVIRRGFGGGRCPTIALKQTYDIAVAISAVHPAKELIKPIANVWCGEVTGIGVLEQREEQSRCFRRVPILTILRNRVENLIMLLAA